MKNLFLSIFTLGISFTATYAQGYFPEAGNWQSKTPKELGVDAGKLQEAIRFAETHESTENRNLKIAHYEGSFGREPFGYPVGPMKERGPATGLIIYKGYVVGQWGDPARVDLTFSVAKSFLSTTAGLAVDAGLIRSVQDLVHPYMAPIYPYDPLRLAVNKADHLDQEDIFDLFNTPHNQKITWDNLLRATRTRQQLRIQRHTCQCVGLGAIECLAQTTSSSIERKNHGPHWSKPDLEVDRIRKLLRRAGWTNRAIRKWWLALGRRHDAFCLGSSPVWLPHPSQWKLEWKATHSTHMD